MAILALNAVLHYTQVRPSIALNTEVDEPITLHTIPSISIKRSTVASVFARNIALNPVTGYPLRIAQFAENQIATYLDQDYEIRGIVKDSAGLPLQRRVLVLTRDGTRLGITRSLADGTFKVRTTGYQLNRTISIAIPDDGDLRNASVKWGAIPVTPFVEVADPHFNNVRLLLRAGFQSSGQIIRDESPYNTTYTAGGSMAISNTFAKYGTGSIIGTGNINDHIQDADGTVATSNRWNISNNPMTIEAWVYWTPTGLQGFEIASVFGFNGGFPGFTFGVLGNGEPFVTVNGTPIDFSGGGGYAGPVLANEWVHLAAVHDGTFWTCFVNGTPGPKRSGPWTVPATATVRFLTSLKGYADDVRLTAFTQRYAHREYPDLLDPNVSTFTPFIPPSQLPNF